MSISSSPDGVDPSVTAVVITRRDPAGLAALLDAVLGQTLAPDAVVVLDRTAGAVLPAGAARRDGEPALATGSPATRRRPTRLGRAPAPEHDEADRSTHEPGSAGHADAPTGTTGTTGTTTADRSTHEHGSAGHAAPEHAAADRSALEPGSVTVSDLVDSARRTHRVPITLLAVDPRTPARTAAHRALLDHELDGAPTTLAWLLPVGTTPETGTLVALVDTWRRSPSAGIVGPKHLDAADPHLLRALAIRTTRGGRLLSRPAPGEPDQGQYDRSSDALGVPFAGSLVERDLLVDLRGWETSFGDVGADLDLGWRAHNAGRRVVVVPAARMRTEPGVAPAGASTAIPPPCRTPRRPGPRALVGLARPRRVDRGHLGRRRPGPAPPQAPPLGLGRAVVARLARPVPRHRGPLAHPAPPRGEPARPAGPVRAAAGRAHRVGRRRARRPRVAAAPDRRRGQRPQPPLLAGQGGAAPRRARHRRRRGRLRRRRSLPRGRRHHRRGLGAVRRRAHGQQGRRHRALARLDRRMDRRRSRRPRPGRTLGAPARAAHLAGRPPPAAARPRVRRGPGRRTRRRLRDAARGRERLHLPPPRGRHPLGPGPCRVRVGDHRGRLGLRGPGPARGARRPHPAAADRVRVVAARPSSLHGHECVRHGARRGGARCVRPGAARAGLRAGPRAGRGAFAGACARPGRRDRARRRARPVVRPPGRGLLAGARRRGRSGPVGRHDARPLAAGPAQPGWCGRTRWCGPPCPSSRSPCSRSCAVAPGAARPPR